MYTQVLLPSLDAADCRDPVDRPRKADSERVREGRKEIDGLRRSRADCAIEHTLSVSGRSDDKWHRQDVGDIGFRHATKLVARPERHAVVGGDHERGRSSKPASFSRVTARPTRVSAKPAWTVALIEQRWRPRVAVHPSVLPSFLLSPTTG